MNALIERFNGLVCELLSDLQSVYPKLAEPIINFQNEYDYQNAHSTHSETLNDNISQTDREVLADFCLNGERFTNGPKVKEFENIWSKWLGVKNSTMINSGSSGNYISIAIVKELLGVGEIIVPPLTWISDISSVLFAGYKPVFCDINMKNLSFDMDKLKQCITPNTKAIFVTHVLGINALTDELIKLCEDNNIFEKSLILKLSLYQNLI